MRWFYLAVALSNGELDVVQYAVEWKGIGRSLRPAFKPKNAAEADAFFVESLEEWREELKVSSHLAICREAWLFKICMICYSSARQVHSLRPFNGGTVRNILCIQVSQGARTRDPGFTCWRPCFVADPFEASTGPPNCVCAATYSNGARTTSLTSKFVVCLLTMCELMLLLHVCSRQLAEWGLLARVWSTGW